MFTITKNHNYNNTIII